MNANKPLGYKAYGSIPHLPGSRRGPKDHGLNAGQARMLTVEKGRKQKRIVVRLKVDGSNTAVAKLNNRIVPLTRAGYVAWTSRFENHHLFAAWVQHHEQRFSDLLGEGERVCGEWLAQAHGTRYELRYEPFAPFDIMRKRQRVLNEELTERCTRFGFHMPPLLHEGKAISIEKVAEMIDAQDYYGELDPNEGAVWRAERETEVEFLAKYVRPGKEDGCYLSDKSPIWNWHLNKNKINSHLIHEEELDRRKDEFRSVTSASKDGTNH